MMKSQQQLCRNQSNPWLPINKFWPESDDCGVSDRGSLKQLIKQLEALSHNPGWFVFINPPKNDWTQALKASDIDLNRVLQVRASDEYEAQWALEQAVAQGNCAAAVTWLPQLDNREQRRLQLVSRKAQCPGYVVQPNAPVWSIPIKQFQH